MRVLLLLIGSLLTVQTFSQGFTITGNLKGLPAKTRVVYTDLNGKDTFAKGTAVNGVFTLKGKLADADSRLLVFPDANKRLVLFIGNDNVTVNGDLNTGLGFSITGSQTQKDYEEFLYYLKPVNDNVNFFFSQLQQGRTQGAKDSALIQLNAVYSLYQQMVDQFVQRRPTSPMSALLIAYSYQTDPNKSAETASNRIKFLKGDALKSKYAVELSDELMAAKIGAVGTEALDFKQNDVNGKPISLSSFKGKYVLLDFWASWCGPCRAENPNVVSAYNKYKDKNFTVLGVSLDQDKQSWLQAIAADKLTWTHVSDLQYWSNAVAQMYRIQSIPQNFLIDPNGKIIGKNLRGEELQAKLKELIK
jgi:peroxiredoxin